MTDLGPTREGRVRPPFEAAFGPLLAFSDAEFDAFEALVRDQGRAAYVMPFARAVAASAPRVPPTFIEELIVALATLSELLEDGVVDSETILRDVVNEVPTKTASQAARLRSRAARLLAIPGLSAMTRGFAALTATGNVLMSADAKTDVRFLEHATGLPRDLQWVFIHHLRLKFRRADRDDVFDIELDDDDIERLIAMLLRTRDMAAELRSRLGGSGYSYIPPVLTDETT